MPPQAYNGKSEERLRARSDFAMSGSHCLLHGPSLFLCLPAGGGPQGMSRSTKPPLLLEVTSTANPCPTVPRPMASSPPVKLLPSAQALHLSARMASQSPQHEGCRFHFSSLSMRRYTTVSFWGQNHSIQSPTRLMPEFSCQSHRHNCKEHILVQGFSPSPVLLPHSVPLPLLASCLRSPPPCPLHVPHACLSAQPRSVH